MTIKDKTVLVTGANRGIGQALAAEALARALAIFEAVDNGEEEIFPDPTSAPMAAVWHDGTAKLLERQLARVARVTS